MAEGNHCPECGMTLSPEATPGQLCPRCLLSLGLDPETEKPGNTPPVDPLEDLESTEIAGGGGAPPGRVGPYRILQKLGEGGMGEVFEAEQLEPVRRKVALKLIKWGMDTRRVVARFEAERQALALMNHRSIARVYEAGATEQGRPYFAMELVKGVPITDYCDRHLLSTPDRLDLFVQVCDGIQHAHHKGIIHRDIKPSNVLVAIEDDKPVPKIIDFGVAKATEQRLTEKTVFTELGQLVGTPEYMSPEQAEMTGLDIDTRTDVYSLGVLLYQLLSGALPFESAELRRAGYDEIRRRIREDEPSKPSTRLSSLGECATAAAKNRGTDPGSLVRRLRGDLDWISMKALEKDRTRRYGSPQELAADVARHLGSEPVLAGPPSAAYKAKKFVRRHRFGVAAASVVLLALVLGVVGTTIGMLRAVAAEGQARAEARRAEAGKLFVLGRETLDKDPSAALAYATASLELADTDEARQFALRALWRGPTAFKVGMPEYTLSIDFAGDGGHLAAGGWAGTHQVWLPDGSTVIRPRAHHDAESPETEGETQFTTHEQDELVFVDFSDDGRFHVSSSQKSVHVWSVAERRELYVLDIQPWWLEVRGEDLLTLTETEETGTFSIQRWPLAGGDPVEIGVWVRPDALSDPFGLLRVDVDPSGEWLTYALGPELFVLPIKSAGSKRPRLIGRGEQEITRVYFLPDGERIATSEPTSRSQDECVIRLWSRSNVTQEPLRSFPAPLPSRDRDAPWVRARKIRFDRTGRWMSAHTLSGASFALWDLEAPPGTEPLILVNGKILSGSTALHPEGSWLASGEGFLSIWPLTGKYSRVLLRQKEMIQPVGFGPRGEWLASTSWDGKIRLWSLDGAGGDAGRILYEVDHPLGPAAVSPDGERIAAPVWDGRVVVVSLSGNPPIELHGFASPVMFPVFDREGRRVAVGGGIKLGSDAVTRVWDLETGEVQVLDRKDGKAVWNVHFTPDDGLLSCGDGGLVRWDLKTGSSELLAAEPFIRCRTSPDDRYALIVRREEKYQEFANTSVHVYDLQERTTRALSAHDGAFSATWHPSGGQIVTSDWHGVVRVGPVSGEEPHVLIGHGGLIYDLVVSPNGKWIASGCDDGTLRLWPWPEGRPVHTLPHADFVAKLRSLTNYRVARDEESFTGYRLDYGPFPGWKDLPTW